LEWADCTRFACAGEGRIDEFPGIQEPTVISVLDGDFNQGYWTSPFKVYYFVFLASKSLLVDTCGFFGSLVLGGRGFLGPRGCFLKDRSLTFFAKASNCSAICDAVMR
jgi:hypothetical protein